MSNISYFCGWSDDNLLKPYCWNRWSCYPHFCRLAGPGLQILQILPFCRIISASARDCDTFITYHGVDFWDWGGRMSTNTFMIMSLLWIHNIYIVSLNYLSQLLSKTFFTSEQFILILASTFKPNGSLSSTVYSVLGHLSSITYQPFDTALTGGFCIKLLYIWAFTALVVNHKWYVHRRSKNWWYRLEPDLWIASNIMAPNGLLPFPLISPSTIILHHIHIFLERAGVPSLSYCHWSIYFFSPPMRRLYSLLCWVNFQLLILWTRTIWNQYLYQQQWIPEAALAKMLCSFKNTIDAIPIDKYYFRGSWCEQDKWYMKSIRGREIFQD